MITVLTMLTVLTMITVLTMLTMLITLTELTVLTELDWSYSHSPLPTLRLYPLYHFAGLLSPTW